MTHEEERQQVRTIVFCGLILVSALCVPAISASTSGPSSDIWFNQSFTRLAAGIDALVNSAGAVALSLLALVAAFKPARNGMLGEYTPQLLGITALAFIDEIWSVTIGGAGTLV